MAQIIKNLFAMQETRVQSLGQEDLPEKGMATHSSILTWKIPWMEEPGWLHTVHGVTESDTTEQLHSLKTNKCGRPVNVRGLIIVLKSI